MPRTETPNTIDPLRSFLSGAFGMGRDRPIPLISTGFNVVIEAGVGVVETTRRFRNDERESIEATITFPIPVQAVLYSLEARIEGRNLKAIARRRDQAREDYESAIERGKTAVLHEEILRGVHMLSVAHLPPGGEIVVHTKWAITLPVIDGKGILRIPLTVGDIYGSSSLPDSDDLAHGGPNRMARLVARNLDGPVELVGGRLDEFQATVPLNAPIELRVPLWKPRALCGRAADGRLVTLHCEPKNAPDASLDVALLGDRSGSMAELASGHSGTVTKHQAIMSALNFVAERLGSSDRVDLWEFNTTLTHVGSTDRMDGKPTGAQGPGQILGGLVSRLGAPEGGTEIGVALSGINSATRARDILVMTDGKSHHLDVHALAREGRRVTVVLIGEDSLEATIGHLAALTAGDIFVPVGTEIPAAIETAMTSLRRPAKATTPIQGIPHHIETLRGNVALAADWLAAESQTPSDETGSAAVAVATSLALPALDRDAAAALAEAEGLVSHLTSLVLVDEDASAQEGLPATRKIALPTPRTDAFMACMDSAMQQGGLYYRPALPALLSPSFITIAAGDLRSLGATIDWGADPNLLVAGDLSGLEPETAALIEQAAERPEIIALARHYGISPLALVIGLIARSQPRRNRVARRVAKAILRNLPPHPLKETADLLGSGLIDQSQKMTVAAMQMADMKVWAHRS